MPSSSLAFLLCFASFLFGQLFNVLCTSLSAPVVEAVSFVPESSGVSLKILFIVVVSVLAIHDTVLVLVLWHLFAASRPASSKSLIQIGRQLPSVFFVLAPGHSAASDTLRTPWFMGRSPVFVQVLQPFRNSHWHTVKGLVWATLPRLFEHPAALVLFTNRSLPPVRVSPPRNHGHFWLFYFLLLHAASVPTQANINNSTCDAFIEEIGDEEDFVGTLILRKSSTAKAPSISQQLSGPEFLIGIPTPCDRNPQVVWDLLRSSLRSSVPRYLIAVATSREWCANVDREACPASLVDVVKEVNTAKEFADEKDVMSIEDTSKTLIIEEDAASKASVEDKMEDLAPLYEEIDPESAPSYEEFAANAPSEPLFENKGHTSLDFAVNRPPSLDVLVARLGAKARPSPARAARLTFLGRLSPRLNNVCPIVRQPVSPVCWAIRHRPAQAPRPPNPKTPLPLLRLPAPL
ncbi:hypothetical protein B0H11DRAFT_306960 [Mycena galericulata]|nr:hypothetical protein B0H11DRAFT_306960 [Mycena galericulata]